MDPDELDYYMDLAINEAGTWIQKFTREPFDDPEDIFHSLKNGLQLPKLVNAIIGESRVPLIKNKWIPEFVEACRCTLGLDLENELISVEDDLSSITLKEAESEDRPSTIIWDSPFYGPVTPIYLQRIKKVLTTILELATRLDSTRQQDKQRDQPSTTIDNSNNNIFQFRIQPEYSQQQNEESQQKNSTSHQQGRNNPQIRLDYSAILPFLNHNTTTHQCHQTTTTDRTHNEGEIPACPHFVTKNSHNCTSSSTRVDCAEREEGNNKQTDNINNNNGSHTSSPTFVHSIQFHSVSIL